MTEHPQWKLRQLTSADLAVLGRLDRDAFNSWFAGRGTLLEERSTTDLLALLGRTGCALCAGSLPGDPVGYVFGRLWGRWGWFGPLGCAPAEQGRGVGSLLVRRATESLLAEADVVGLETMGDNYENVTLYTRLGFRAVGPTLLMRAPASMPQPAGAEERGYAKTLDWDDQSEARRSELLGQLKTLFARLAPGLDYTQELLIARRDGTGRTVLWQTSESRLLGFAHVRTTGHRVNDPDDAAEVEFFGFEPGVRGGEAVLYLQGLVKRLRQAGKKDVRVWAPACWGDTLAVCVEVGFKPVRARQRMIHHSRLDTYLQTVRQAAREHHIHGATWAG